MRKVLAVLVLLLLIAGGVWFMAGRQAGPTLTFTKPGPLIGQTGDLELRIDPHGSPLETLTSCSSRTAPGRRCSRCPATPRPS